jgi:hypothetical protein
MGISGPPFVAGFDFLLLGYTELRERIAVTYDTAPPTLPYRPEPLQYFFPHRNNAALLITMRNARPSA